MDVFGRTFTTDDPSHFCRFVDLLEASRAVTTLRVLAEWNVDRLPDDDDIVRLFGDVLPNHPTLRRLNFDVGQLPIRFFRMLTENLPTTAENSSPVALVLQNWAIDPAICALAAQAIGDMLCRGAAVAGLDLGLRLEADQCKLICQAVPRNSFLGRFELQNVVEVRADTLVGAAASSSLRWLEVRASSFSDDAVPVLARQLRSNESIATLYLLDKERATAHQASIEAMLDLVKTYNYTLESIRGIASWYGTDREQEQMKEYLLRNGRIRKVLQQLRTSKSDFKSTSTIASSRQVVVLPREQLPILLDCVSDVPTALFRILKMGYGVEVSACISAKFNSNGPCTGLRRSVRLRRRRRCRSDDD